MNKRSDFLHWSAGIASVITCIEIAHIIKTNIHHADNCIMRKFSILAFGIFLLTILYRYFRKRKK